MVSQKHESADDRSEEAQQTPVQTVQWFNDLAEWYGQRDKDKRQKLLPGLNPGASKSFIKGGHSPSQRSIRDLATGMVECISKTLAGGTAEDIERIESLGKLLEKYSLSVDFREVLSPLKWESIFKSIVAGDVGQDPVSSVQEFYGAINSHRYGIAWNHLTKEFQKRIWPEGVDRFAELYKNFRGFTRLGFFQLPGPDKNSSTVGVYLEEEPDIALLDEFSTMNGVHLAPEEMDSLVTFCNNFRARLVSAGADPVLVNGLELVKLFRQDRVEYLWHKLKLSHEQCSSPAWIKIFGRNRRVKIERLRMHRVVLVDGRWKSDVITPNDIG